MVEFQMKAKVAFKTTVEMMEVTTMIVGAKITIMFCMPYCTESTSVRF